MLILLKTIKKCKEICTTCPFLRSAPTLRWKCISCAASGVFEDSWNTFRTMFLCKCPTFPGKQSLSSCLQHRHAAMLCCHVSSWPIWPACHQCLCLTDTRDDTHTHESDPATSFPLHTVTFPQQPLAGIDWHVQRDGDWCARLSAGRLTTTSLSPGSWHVNRWHARSSAASWQIAASSSWTGLFLAAHPPACYLGWLMNNTARQREVCLHHVLAPAHFLIKLQPFRQREEGREMLNKE